ncbi:MAG: hypothetical protein IJI65_09395 [Lachnospiraceae bacterium]|nr:hypothetical protein [Lachnospiraceae bacterium]
MKKLYFRELRQCVEMEDEIADALDGDRARVRMDELNNGRCRISKDKLHLCDGNCIDCEFHHEGWNKVETNACDNCPYGVARTKRRRDRRCRGCENYRFLENVSIDENEDGPSYMDKFLGTSQSPEEIFLEKEAIEEYKEMAKDIEGGDAIIDGLSAGETISEIAMDTGRPQSTVDSRKDRVKKAIEEAKAAKKTSAANNTGKG